MGEGGRPIRDQPFVRLFLFWESLSFFSADSRIIQSARHTIVLKQLVEKPVLNLGRPEGEPWYESPFWANCGKRFRAEGSVLVPWIQLRGRFDQLILRGLLGTLLLSASPAAADCIPIAEARQHIGEDQCVTGKVFRVKHAGRGVTLFDFCQDSMVCPFTVVVFPHDLKRIGDVSQLQNRVIEIHGPVKEYDGRAEIVLNQLRQLGGTGPRIPPLPKNFDVENKGKYRAGTFSQPKAPYKTSPKKQTAAIPINVPSDAESEGTSPPQ